MIDQWVSKRGEIDFKFIIRNDSWTDARVKSKLIQVEFYFVKVAVGYGQCPFTQLPIQYVDWGHFPSLVKNTKNFQ